MDTRKGWVFYKGDTFRGSRHKSQDTKNKIQTNLKSQIKNKKQIPKYNYRKGRPVIPKEGRGVTPSLSLSPQRGETK
jgi:hypothetical protein